MSLFLSFTNLFAANSLSYSGRLVLASGAPVTGPVNLRAELVYTNATSTILCFQNLSSVALTKGVFHLKLDFDCTPSTLSQVLQNIPATHAVAIRIIDQSNAKTYPLQALHAIPLSLLAEQLPQMGASAGQALAWDGSKWAPTSFGTGNGTVMSVTAGAGLSGGTITTTGTISIAAGGVGTTELANNSVTAAKINAGEITSSHISATANIPYSKLSIGAGEIPQDRINGLAGSMSALIEDVIADAVTGKAPSQNAVYDALGLKADRSNVAQNITAASVVGLIAPTVGSAAANRDYVDNSSATVDTRITNEVSTLNTSIGNKYDKAGGVITGDVTLNTQLLLKGGANFVTVKANAGTANYVMTLPTSAGINGYVLQTDGAGVLSWVNPSSVSTGTGTVNSASITDGSIVDADINASANIAQSKISGLTTSLSGKENTITAGTTAQYYRGDKSWQTLNTLAVPENTNLYFTEQRVRDSLLTGINTTTSGAISGTDSVLSGLGKTQKQLNDISSGTTANQWTENLGNVYRNSGNVGVGVINPIYKLDVAGDVNVTGNFKVNGANISSGLPGGADTQVQFNTAGTFAGDSNLIYDNTNKRLSIGPQGAKDRLSISHNNGSGGDLVNLYTPTSSSALIEFQNTSGSYRAGVNGSVFQITNQWPLTPDFVVANGNVGIGTSTPTQKLDVVGNLNATQVCIAGDCKSAWPTGVSAGSITTTEILDGTIATA
ncbi:MAG: hypothetical protein L6Q33_04900, partial [Bacteriovoracaceae bacterium]|nr:hypothetical protein [Bacteriovoracaceae bacterium]